MTNYLFIAVLAFAAGVATRDQAEDRAPAKSSCQKVRENAERFSRAVAEVLNGGSIKTDDVIASCRVHQIRRDQ